MDGGGGALREVQQVGSARVFGTHSVATSTRETRRPINRVLACTPHTPLYVSTSTQQHQNPAATPPPTLQTHPHYTRTLLPLYTSPLPPPPHTHTPRHFSKYLEEDIGADDLEELYTKVRKGLLLGV